jgi:hypothetical protein
MLTLYDIVALDDSSFYLRTGYELLWLPRDERVPGRQREKIQSKSSCGQSFEVRAGSIEVMFLKRSENSTASIKSPRDYRRYSNGAQIKRVEPSEN